MYIQPDEYLELIRRPSNLESREVSEALQVQVNTILFAHFDESPSLLSYHCLVDMCQSSIHECTVMWLLHFSMKM